MNNTGNRKANEIGNGKIVTDWVSQAMYAVIKGLTRQRAHALKQNGRLEIRRYLNRIQVRDIVEN